METWEVTFEEKDDAPLEGAGETNGYVNVGKGERIASTVVGGALIGYGIKRRSVPSLLLATFGAGLVYRGLSGHCEAYTQLNINTAETESVPRDFHVEKSITILQSPQELYRFWRKLENLPRFMENLESVTELDGNRSHWVAKGPAGKLIEWDAEIFNEKENELIAWRSLADADVVNAGSVHFEETRSRGTRVKVSLNYNAPGGKISVLFAKLFGTEPGQLIEHNLKRLKQLLETGEIPTVQGQTSGREELPEIAGRKENKLASKPASEVSVAARKGAA